MGFKLNSVETKAMEQTIFKRSVLGLIILMVFPSTVSSQVQSECHFNGVKESCILTRLWRNGSMSGVKVRWISDGKVVSYYYSNCRNYAGGTVDECHVKIVEDNGRITYAASTSSGRGTQIRSTLGNRTVIPPF